MSADLRPPREADSPESADFSLSPEENEKGRQAFEAYIESLRPGDPQRLAIEALDIVAAVISGGRCTADNFPWQQVRGYHTALSLSIIREPGTPSRVEALLCRNDDTRKFQQVSDRYAPKQVQRMSAALARVVEECRNLGFLDDEEFELARHRGRAKTDAKAVQGRTISEGEVRALIAASVMDTTAPGPRDALMIGLGFSGGLRTVDLVNLNLDDMHFDNKSGRVTVRFRAPGAKRARRIPLRNDQLISLEDWLATRGREPGPLFCPLTRSGKIVLKRISAAEMRDLCAKRSEQAGVLPFAPNDLARSGTLVGDASRKRSRNRSQTTRMVKVSPLYGDEAEPAEEGKAQPAQIHFPYRARPGL